MLRDAIPAPARRVIRRVRAARAARLDAAPSTAEVQGFTLRLPRHFQHHYVQQDYEPLSRAFLLEHVRAGTKAVDVGAHIGLYSLLMARAAGPTGSVVAVEPAEENLTYLRWNLRANGFAERVTVIAAAATDHDGTVRFHLTGSSDSHGLHPHPNTPTRKVVEIPALRLDSALDAVDFVKIDTEGAELTTLAGMEGLLTAPGARAALVEWAPRCQESAGRGLTELPDALADLGFELQVLDDHARTERSVGEVAADLRSGRLSGDWYGNLACVRPA